MESENVYAPPGAGLEPSLEKDQAEPILATKGDRFLAFVIDAIISLVVSLPFLHFTGFWQKSTTQTITIFDSVVIILFGLLMYLVLHGNLLAKYGQTIGKRILKIQIGDVDDNQILPLWKVYLLRFLPQNLVFQIPVIGGLVAIVDVLFIFRKNRRTLHDLVAGTKVIELPRVK